MPRYVLLETIDVSLVAAPPIAPGVPAAAVAKLDVRPEYIGVDRDGNFSFSVPAYEVSTHNVLSALHVSLFEKPAIVPADPAVIVKAALHYETSTAAVAAQTVVVDATAAPEGSYSAALVAEFAE